MNLNGKVQENSVLKSSFEKDPIWMIVTSPKIIRIFRKVGNIIEDIGTATTDTNDVNDVYDILQFQHDFAKWLFDNQNFFNRLIIIGLPRYIKNTKSTFHPDLQRRILAEIDKNFIELNENDILKALENLIWFQKN